MSVQAVNPILDERRFSMAGQARRGLLLAGGLALLVFGWGSVARISGAVVAQGRVTLESSVRKVQHREGGIVGDILVHEGDHVAAGQVLVRLDPTVADANEAAIQTQIWQLTARQARLQAERDNRGAGTIAVEASAPLEYRRIVEAERELMLSRARLRAQKKAEFREQITQGDHEIEGDDAQISSVTQQSDLIKQELVSVRGLYQKGFAPFTRVSELQRQADELDGQKGQLQASIARTRASAAQINQQILQVDSEALSDVMNDLKDTETKLGQLRGQEITAHDTSSRVEIRAPATGLVQQLAEHTKGGVVAPGETLMLVVPENDELIVEARIDPTKINNVHVGSVAHVRFTAFDTRTTPEAAGKVDTVSSEVKTDEKTGTSFYRARLAFAGMNVPSKVRSKLVSGMPVEVQIETGSHSALSYFLKPLTDQLSRKRCFQTTSLRLAALAYAHGNSSSIWLLGWPLTIRVMTSCR